MFKKKKCSKCNEKINSKYDFCPYCGNSFTEKENWGMLGKNDLSEQSTNLQNNIFGGMGGGILNKMLGNAMKMLEKEMQKEMNNTQQPIPKNNFELIINGKRVDPKNIKVSQSPIIQKQVIKKAPSINFSDKDSKKFSSLKKEEPETNIRRLSNKIIYELKLPGIKSLKDISIIKLENSIEIKAISEDKAYLKIISVNLPLLNYNFSEEKLILELEAKN
jgi:HSP20 family molecular chaperone IbpA